MRIAFLHIPKTAGQSVHHSLTGLYLPDEICPARTNEALYKYSISDLSKYKLFSGHLDWSIIRLTGRFDYVFTVLRDPLDRILSFYFYLRKEAERLQKEGKPIGAGMKAAIQWSPRQYFTGGQIGLRTFLDNHYNNFYSYYFASGSYSGFSQLSSTFPPGSSDLLDYANLGLKSLNAIYTISNLGKLESEIKSIFKLDLQPISEVNVNRQVLPSTRSDNLTKLAGDWDWKPTLKELTKADEIIFNKYNSNNS